MRKAVLIMGLALAMSPALLAQTEQQPSGSPPQGGDKPAWNGQRGERGPRGGGQRGQMMRQKMMQRLNLTDDQRTRLQGIMKQQREQGRAIHENTNLTQEQRQEQLKSLHQSTRTQLDAVLTPDQLTELKKMREEFKQRREQWRNGEGRPGGESRPESKPEGNQNEKPSTQPPPPSGDDDLFAAMVADPDMPGPPK